METYGFPLFITCFHDGKGCIEGFKEGVLEGTSSQLVRDSAEWDTDIHQINGVFGFDDVIAANF
jgi:hypothetical protein